MLDDKALASLNPENLSAYLARSGWVNEGTNRDTIYKFVHNNGGFLILPASQDAPRYLASVNNVINTISAWEKRSPFDVFQSIANPNTDTLLFTFRGESTRKGSMPLNNILDAITHVKQTILYSACGEIKPKPLYTGPLRPAIEIASNAKFGQTQFGSFVMAISLSHTPQESDPIERRVMKRIIFGAMQAKDYVMKNKRLDIEKDYLQGLNANIAEALSELSINGFSMGISSKWDSNIEISDSFKQSIEIGEQTFDMLKSVSKSYHGNEVFKPIDILEAQITNLKRDDDEPDVEDVETQPVVTLKIINPKSTVSKVQVHLDNDEYTKACIAHGNSEHVKIKGEFGKINNRWWLLKPKDFQVLK